MDSRRARILLAVTLVAFVIAAYGQTAALPFVGDDYVFLERAVARRSSSCGHGTTRTSAGSVPGRAISISG
jgi:hypothetical protein